MPCRWCCLHCVATHSFVCLFRTGVVYSSSSRYQVPDFFLGHVHTRSSPSPESGSSALERRTQARALFTRFGDGQYAVTSRTSSRTRARIRVARLHSIYWYVQRRYTRYICIYEVGVILSVVVLVSYSIIVAFHIYQRYVKCRDVYKIAR